MTGPPHQLAAPGRRRLRSPNETVQEAKDQMLDGREPESSMTGAW
jgi:hypothetical protein